IDGRYARIGTSIRVGRRTASSTRARVPIRAYRPSILGTTKIAESAACAAATAFRASSVSKAIVTTIPGSTTPVVRGRRGTTSVFGRSSSRLVFIVSSRSLYFYLLVLTKHQPLIFQKYRRQNPCFAAGNALRSLRVLRSVGRNRRTLKG